jgi:phosphate starvation-inducible protein PhoH
MVVVDEAQNLEPTTLKTILTRIGEGTKVVFTGDTSQIDAPYLGESNNALARVEWLVVDGNGDAASKDDVQGVRLVAFVEQDVATDEGALFGVGRDGLENRRTGSRKEVTCGDD